MTYTLAAVLAMAGALTLDLVVARTRLVLRRVFWATYPVVVVFQLIFNGILTGRGVVLYDPAAIIGVRVVGAPVEDLVFGFALILMSLSVWVWWERRGVGDPDVQSGSRSGSPDARARG